MVIPGAPIYETFWGLHPGEWVKYTKAPCLFVIAEKDTVVPSLVNTRKAVTNHPGISKVGRGELIGFVFSLYTDLYTDQNFVFGVTMWLIVVCPLLVLRIGG